MQKYREARLMPWHVAVYFGLDAGMVAGESAFLRFYASFAQMNRETADMAFNYLLNSRLPISHEVSAEAWRYVPKFIRQICHSRCHYAKEKQEDGANTAQIILKELDALVASGMAMSAVVLPLLTFVPAVIKYAPSSARFVEAFDALVNATRDIRFFGKEFFEFLTVVAEQQVADKWAQTVMRFVTENVQTAAHGGDLTRAIQSILVASDFCAKADELWKTQRPELDCPVECATTCALRAEETRTESGQSAARALMEWKRANKREMQ
jgi:hypothetical protein